MKNSNTSNSPLSTLDLDLLNSKNQILIDIPLGYSGLAHLKNTLDNCIEILSYIGTMSDDNELVKYDELDMIDNLLILQRQIQLPSGEYSELMQLLDKEAEKRNNNAKA